MRLAVFGASGRVGQELLFLASTRGWAIKALARPSAACEPQSGLEVIRGVLDSLSDVAATIVGTEAVCCVFGPRSARAEPFCARATNCIITAMMSAGPRRLLCLTGAMVGELPRNVSLPMRLMAATYRRQCPGLAADAAEQERAVIESGLDWTLVKPARLTSGRASENPRAGQHLHVGLMSRVRRADLAAFMLDEVLASRHLRQRVYVRD